MLTEGRVRAIAAQVASVIAAKIKPSVSEEQIRSDVEAVVRQMKERGDFDDYTPVKGVDYYTPKEKAEWETFIITEIAKRGQINLGFVRSIEMCTDPLKIYVLPDRYVYEAIPVERPAYDNVLSTAVGTDEKPYNEGLGYKAGLRIKSDGSEVDQPLMCSMGYLPVRGGDVVRIKNTTKASGSGVSGADFHMFYKADFTVAVSGYYGYYEPENEAYNTKPDDNGVITIVMPANAVYYRYTTGVIDENTIVTINEPITDKTIIVYEWRNAGISFAPADYEGRIVDLETDSENHEDRISEIERKMENGDFEDKTFAERVAAFKDWDRPIYDRVPAFALADEAKSAITAEMRTPAAIYQAYDNLMTQVNTDDWTYITKTLLGQDESGNDVYKYDFKVPDQPRLAASALSKAVPKVILVSGVHNEWAGIYGLYNAMYEIATNPDLSDLKHNTHIIVMPMVNAYACTNGGRKNINGVDIARNFEVDWVESDASADTYGGTGPLSEKEAQYVDAVMSANSDALFFASCHNHFNNTDYLNVWGCAATKFTHNLYQLLVDKMSRMWGKYDFVPENVYLGATDISAPNGSEGKHAMKYGIQGGTLECRARFAHQSSTEFTAFAMSRMAEVYINFLLTALGNHSAGDKRAF